MIRNLKVITAALAALLAMGAFASMAQAGSLDADIGPGGTTVLFGTNTNTHVFKIEGGETKCTNVTFEGTITGITGETKTGIAEATVTPIYTGCTTPTIFGNVEVRVRSNGCKYRFTGAGQAALTANVDITECTSGKVIEVEIPLTGCIITVKEQGPLSHVTFVNNTIEKPTSEMDTTATATVSGIHYVEGANCPKPGTFATGTYEGAVTLKGFESLGTESATHTGHTYNKHKLGSQLEVTAT